MCGPRTRLRTDVDPPQVELSCWLRGEGSRAVARIFVRGVDNRGWGQARPKRSRAGMGFLGGAASPLPISYGSGGAPKQFLAFYRRHMVFPGITIVQTECVSTHVSHFAGRAFYIAKKCSFQHFGGGGEPVTPPPFKYGLGAYHLAAPGAILGGIYLVLFFVAMKANVLYAVDRLHQRADVCVCLLVDQLSSLRRRGCALDCKVRHASLGFHGLRLVERISFVYICC